MALTADQTAMGEETATTYRAAVVRGFDQPLTIERVTPPALEARPDPREGRGVRPVSHGHPRRTRRLAGQPSPPFTPGHEGVGVVTELGPA